MNLKTLYLNVRKRDILHHNYTPTHTCKNTYNYLYVLKTFVCAELILFSKLVFVALRYVDCFACT